MQQTAAIGHDRLGDRPITAHEICSSRNLLVFGGLPAQREPADFYLSREFPVFGGLSKESERFASERQFLFSVAGGSPSGGSSNGTHPREGAALQT